MQKDACTPLVQYIIQAIISSKIKNLYELLPVRDVVPMLVIREIEHKAVERKIPRPPGSANRDCSAVIHCRGCQS
jgi:hypothetical protein